MSKYEIYVKEPRKSWYLLTDFPSLVKAEGAFHPELFDKIGERLYKGQTSKKLYEIRPVVTPYETVRAYAERVLSPDWFAIEDKSGPCFIVRMWNEDKKQFVAEFDVCTGKDENTVDTYNFQTRKRNAYRKPESVKRTIRKLRAKAKLAEEAQKQEELTKRTELSEKKYVYGVCWNLLRGFEGTTLYASEEVLRQHLREWAIDANLVGLYTGHPYVIRRIEVVG